MGKSIELRSGDGFTLSAYRAEPAGDALGARNAIVVVQEIFGVNAHIRSVCDGYAQLGYLAIAPALFDRAERALELGYDREAVTKGGPLARKLDPAVTLQDIQAAIDYAATESGGKVGLVGYCFGGSMAWLAAAECSQLTAVAAYYGAQVSRLLDHRPRVPIILHFGERDASIPTAEVDKIRSAYPDVPVYRYDAEHGFNCSVRGSYHETSAQLALDRTVALFRATMQ